MDQLVKRNQQENQPKQSKAKKGKKNILSGKSIVFTKVLCYYKSSTPFVINILATIKDWRKNYVCC